MYDKINRLFIRLNIQVHIFISYILYYNQYQEIEYVSLTNFFFKFWYISRKRMNGAEALGHNWLKTAEQQKTLSKTKLKRYVIKKQWIRATNTILALRRMGAQLK